MEAPASNPVVDRVLCIAETDELVMRHLSVLPGGEGPDPTPSAPL